MIKSRKMGFLFDICLCLIFIVSSFAEEECDKTKCPGPLRYYEDLRCNPIYKNPGDCCAVKYDCSHLESRSPKKCYINDNVYEMREKLKDEDALACDIGCFCGEGQDGNAHFICAVVDCFQRPRPGCSMVHYGKQCCATEVCPDREKVTCIVDGKTYEEGDEFEAKEEPNKKCVCRPGYEGENAKPYCYIPSKTKSYCGTELRHASEIREKCAPVYYNEQSPQTSCSVSWRCQNNNDTLIPNTENSEGDSDTCKFGNIVMRIGDELNQATSYSSVCVKCKCEVPPTPTCQRLSDNECDVTVHPNFDNY